MIANRLRELRKEKKLTLEALADALGTSRQTIHRYENGIISNIPKEKIEALAKVLGTSPSQLMGWESTSYEYKDTADYSVFDNVYPIATKKLPLVGSIACGEPIYATEEHECYVAADSRLDASFCLKAVGDSMIGARIYDGDIVFIRQQDSVDNGEIAAVIINDEATLKRVYYYPEEGKLILSPENPRYAPLVYLKDELDTIKIIGKAIAFQSTVF